MLSTVLRDEKLNGVQGDTQVHRCALRKIIDYGSWVRK
jgi:hypothetical protein